MLFEDAVHPHIHLQGLQPVVAEERHALGHLDAHAADFHQCFPQLIGGPVSQRLQVQFAAVNAAGRVIDIAGPVAEPAFRQPVRPGTHQRRRGGESPALRLPRVEGGAAGPAEFLDGAADGLKKLILRLREKRFDPSTGQREYQFLLTEEFVSLLTAEKYGMLLIMEQAKGTRYDGLRSSLINMLAAKTAPMLADEDNSMLLAQIIARNLIDGMVMVLKNRVRPREIRTNLNRLVEYHTKGIDALLK